MGVSVGMAARVASMRASTVASMSGVGVGVAVAWPRPLRPARAPMLLVGAGGGLAVSAPQAINADNIMASDMSPSISFLEAWLISKVRSKRDPR